MARQATFSLYRSIYLIRPRCPITGKVGNEIHHCLIERGASGLNPRDQCWIDQAWNCVLLSTEGHTLLHGHDPKLNMLCIQSIIDYYGRETIEKNLSEIPFRQPITLDSILQRNT